LGRADTIRLTRAKPSRGLIGPRLSKSLAGAAGLRFPSFEGAERLKNASQI